MLNLPNSPHYRIMPSITARSSSKNPTCSADALILGDYFGFSMGHQRIRNCGIF